MKKCHNDEKDRQHRGCRRYRCILSLEAKLLTQLPFRRLWLRPRQFSSWKVSYRHPRAGFWGRTQNQTSLAPHSGTFNCGEGVKTICQPSYSSKTTTTDFFLFQRGEVDAGRTLAVSGWPHDKLRRGCQNQQQNRVHRYLLAVDGQLRGGLKMYWIRWVFKWFVL